MKIYLKLPDTGCLLLGVGTGVGNNKLGEKNPEQVCQLIALDNVDTKASSGMDAPLCATFHAFVPMVLGNHDSSNGCGEEGERGRNIVSHVTCIKPVQNDHVDYWPRACTWLSHRINDNGQHTVSALCEGSGALALGWCVFVHASVQRSQLALRLYIDRTLQI